jgi:GT2 family glycosyltransferase
MNSVDCIVVNYQTPLDLEDFCESMRDQRISSLTIMNNDPNTEDRVVAARYVKELGAESITLDNVGYANAVNYAAQRVDSDYLAIFNADVVCSPDSVQEMVSFMCSAPHIGIAGPRQVNENGLITHAGIFGTSDKPKIRGWKKKDRGQFNDIRDDCVSVAGSAYFVLRRCWDELTDCPDYNDAVVRIMGGFPAGAFLPTPHYYEETFCSYHAREHGWSVAYNGEIEMIHKWHRASAVGGFAEKMMPISRDMFRQACDEHGIVHD